MITIHDIEPMERLTHRSFTDLRHSAYDLQAMRFMVTCVCLLMEERMTREAEGTPPVHYIPDRTSWNYRIVITQPAALRTKKVVTTVGFFGSRKPDANLPLAQELDHNLLPELFRHKELLCYLSLALPTRNFANLVLFASPQGKAEWGGSRLHADAVRQLTPDFYDNVRLYNGRLEHGITRMDSLSLDIVKYFDYRSDPIWRAQRTLPRQVSTWYNQ